MLSSVLRSPRAIQVNIAIMRTFARLRRILASHAELARKLEELERKYDEQFRVVFDALRELMTPPDPPRTPIGFGVREQGTGYLSKKQRKRGPGSGGDMNRRGTRWTKKGKRTGEADG